MKVNLKKNELFLSKLKPEIEVHLRGISKEFDQNFKGKDSKIFKEVDEELRGRRG